MFLTIAGITAATLYFDLSVYLSDIPFSQTFFVSSFPAGGSNTINYTVVASMGTKDYRASGSISRKLSLGMV